MAGGLLDRLTDADRQALWAVMRRCRFGRGEVVFREGDLADSLHVIVKGHIAARVTTPGGDTVILRVMGRDDLVGDYAVTSDAPRAATAVTLDVAETMVLHRDDFARLRREQPQIDQFLLDAALHEVRRLSAALVDALHVPAERRVLRRLFEVAALWPPGEPLPLSQQDIAQLAGVTRQSANRVLASAQADGLVSIGRGRVEVIDPAGLERAAR